MLTRTDRSRLVLRDHINEPQEGTHEGVVALQGVVHPEFGTFLVRGT